MTDNTVRLSPAATFWVILSALTLIALLVFSDILLPFVAGFVLAYLFHPIANLLCRAGLPRGVAAFTIIAILLLAIAAFLALIVPPIADQVSELIQDFPAITRRHGHTSTITTGIFCSSSRSRRSLERRARSSSSLRKM